MKRKIQAILGSVLINFLCYSSLLTQQITNFTAYDGLVNNTVFSVFEDNQGKIWFGTMRGSGQWKPVTDEWKQYTQENSPLVNNKVNAILQDQDGHLWFGTDRGLSEFDGESWKNYTHSKMPDSLRAEHISCLFLDTKNNLWIGTMRGGVTKRYRDTNVQWRWQSYHTGNSNILSDNITAINEDSWGNIWFGTLDAGICKFDGSSNWTSYSGLTAMGSKINIIFKDSFDTLWLGTSKGVARTYDGANWIPCEIDVNVDPAVCSIAEDSEKNLWFGTEADGLYKYNRNSCIKPPIRGLEYVPTIWSIIRDHYGYLWLGTDGAGVIRLELNWQKFHKENSGLVDNYITSMDQDGDGNLWLGTKLDGLSRYNGVSFDNYDVDGNYSGTNRVNAIMVDRDNWIWCATNYGAHRFDGDPASWISYYEDSLANNRVEAIIQDRKGLYWLATWGGVSRFDPGGSGERWTTIDTSDGLPDWLVTTIFEDHQGSLWLGTAEGGVCQFDGDSIVAVYDTANGLIDNQVNAIIQDKDFSYWFGTAKGISKFNGIYWDCFTRENSDLLDDHVKCMLKDDRDNIWIGTQAGGLSKFDGRNWINFHIEKTGSDEINDIFQDSQGNFWFATINGLVKYCPDNNPPETIIIYQPDNIIGEASALFIFKGIDSETSKDKLVYSWALTDDRSNYIHYWTLYVKESYCRINQLAAGNYKFLVKAKDEAGNEDPTPASYQFTVAVSPPTTIIHYPTGGEPIKSGKIAIIGTACDTSLTNLFKQYWVEYAEVILKNPYQFTEWQLISDTLSLPVINDTLLTWDASERYGSFLLRLSARDLMGRTSEHSVPVQLVETLQEVTEDSGGLLQCSKGSAQLYIPPRALQQDMMVAFSRQDTSKILLVSMETCRYSSTAVLIGPDHIRLDKPATLKVKYSDADIAALNEHKLALFCIDDREICGGFVAPEQNLISTTVTKFGKYILIEDKTSSQAIPFISDFNCQPRIFSPMGAGFSETTNISFNLAANSAVIIKIYNLAGRLVRVILNEPLRAGNNSIAWDGRDYDGKICPSDLYIVAIESEKETETKTVMILDKSHN